MAARRGVGWTTSEARRRRPNLDRPLHARGRVLASPFARQAVRAFRRRGGEGCRHARTAWRAGGDGGHRVAGTVDRPRIGGIVEERSQTMTRILIASVVAL